MDFFWDSNGVLCMAPKKQIEKMIAHYEQLFGEKPKHNVTAPLEKDYHSKMDTTDFLGP